MPPEEEQQGETEETQEKPEEKAPEVPIAPPKPELQIIDYSTKRINPYCTVCGLEKVRYLEVEVKGVIEYTCKDCYRKSKSAPVVPPTATCRKCGTPMRIGDNFCGKCGNPAVLKCPACNNEVEEEDRFCAKCGAKLSLAD